MAGLLSGLVPIESEEMGWNNLTDGYGATVANRLPVYACRFRFGSFGGSRLFKLVEGQASVFVLVQEEIFLLPGRTTENDVDLPLSRKLERLQADGGPGDRETQTKRRGAPTLEC